MPSNEYLRAMLERAKAHLPAEVYQSLHRAALPVSGGRSAWRNAELSTLESVALRELRPAMLRKASDEELTDLWKRLTQWHGRAGRRKQETAPFEQAAGHILQELQGRGLDAGGALEQLAMAKSTLDQRLAELPDVVVIESPAVVMTRSADGLVLDMDSITTVQQQDAVAVALDDIGIPIRFGEITSATPEAEITDLYDLALVRSGAIEKSDDPLSPPEWLLKSEHNGAMIAIMAPPAVREALAAEGLLWPGAPDDLHVTLLYLGEAATLSQAMLAAIESTVGAVCREHRPLRMEVTGLGRFLEAVFGIASAVGLSQLQADLESAVNQVVRLPSEHGWVPHMTLGKVAGDVELPDLVPLVLPGWPAELVCIQVGNQAIAEAPLLGESPGVRASWDFQQKMIREEPDGEKPWALYSRDGSRVLCSEPAKQIIYYLVSEPDSLDAHGHRIDRETIEDALHGYMAGDRKMKLEHGKPVGLADGAVVNSLDGRAVVVEGYIAPCDLTTFHGQKPPDGPIIEGSSIVGVHYEDKALWEKLSAEEHGISWGGFGQQVEEKP